MNVSGVSGVAIIGATGVTGGFAFDEAEKRRLAPIAVGRDPEKLRQFLHARALPENRLRIADVHDTPALHAALADIAVVISTVAPFSDHGFPVAAAAADLGLGYVDCSGEGAFIRRVIDELDPIAQRTRAALCPGNGAAAFLGDIAMHWLIDDDPASAGGVLYDIRGYQPSFGTLRSYLLRIMPTGGALIRNGAVRFEPLGAFAGRVAGVGGIHSVLPDALVISRYWRPVRLDALFKLPTALRPLISCAAALLTWAPLSSRLMRLPLECLIRYDPSRPDLARVTAYAEMRSGRGPVRRRGVTGATVYPLTGAVLAATAQAMLARVRRPAGVRAASEMFASFEEALSFSGLREVGVPG